MNTANITNTPDAVGTIRTLAFVFSGQGAQAPGMGAALADYSEAAARVYEAADALRPGTRKQCAQADKAELDRTVNTQPCLFCVDLAAAEALRARGVLPGAVAGFSVGEIPALAFAGVLTVEEAFRLVCLRAGAMQACADRQHGGMVASVGLQSDAVEAVCKEVGGVYPVNYNCPGQLVIAGPKDKLDAAARAIRREGGKGIPLPVSGAFHSPYMAEAQEALRAHLVRVMFLPPRIPVYANATGKPYEPPYADTLARQVASPVRWQKTLEEMAAAGITTFVEVGVGKTLSGLIKRTLPSARVFQVEDPRSLEDTILAL